MSMQNSIFEKHASVPNQTTGLVHLPVFVLTSVCLLLILANSVLPGAAPENFDVPYPHSLITESDSVGFDFSRIRGKLSTEHSFRLIPFKVHPDSPDWALSVSPPNGAAFDSSQYDAEFDLYYGNLDTEILHVGPNTLNPNYLIRRIQRFEGYLDWSGIEWFDYEDLNFDNHNDLIFYGYSGPYGNQSMEVYLYNVKSGRFKIANAIDQCNGGFTIDYENKTIETAIQHFSSGESTIYTYCVFNEDLVLQSENSDFRDGGSQLDSFAFVDDAWQLVHRETLEYPDLDEKIERYGFDSLYNHKCLNVNTLYKYFDGELRLISQDSTYDWCRE